MENTNLIPVDTGENKMALIGGDNTPMYCSFTPKTEAEKISLFNAINNPEKRLADCINMQINVVHIYAEIVQCVDDETGEVSSAPRIVFIDDKGTAYQCVSLGIFSAVKKIIKIIGEPVTWKKPLKVEVKQITKGKKSLLTLNIAS